MAKRKRRIMREFRIDEISGVDRPAQKGAKVVLMKRAKPGVNPFAEADEEDLDDEGNPSPKKKKKTKADKEAQMADEKKVDEAAKKSDDALEKRFSDMEKRAEAAEKVAADVIQKLADAGFEKRAEAELSHLPGTLPVKATLLKAIDGIADEEVRKGATELLTAADKSASSAFEKVGSAAGNSDEPKAPLAKLEELAKAHAKEHATEKGMTYAKAYAVVCSTPEGAKLYDETQKIAN